MVTLDDVKQNHKVKLFFEQANRYLGYMGFTEHSYRHLSLVSERAMAILQQLGYSERMVQLAGIAGFLHDIGNAVSRQDHGQSGALLSYHILTEMGMPVEEAGEIMAAVGNHEEEYGHAVSPLSAALILADKSDVDRARVRNTDVATFDIHDRVNYAAQKSRIQIAAAEREIIMELTIDLEVSSVMEYFEIFLTRMIMCRRAAEFLGCRFVLKINGARLI